jgi:hypothetical protein
MKNTLFQDLVSGGSFLLKKRSVQFWLGIGACILLYFVTSDPHWIKIGLIYAAFFGVFISIRTSRSAGGSRGTSDGPAAGGPVDLGGDGDGGGGNGGGNGG